MLTLDSVYKQYGSKIAVNNVTFKANKGEIIGFLGPNGAGKTTTMKLIFGFLKPTSGTVTVNNLSPVEDRLTILESVGYLPENNPLYTDMKVSEYLRFVADIKKVDSYSEIAESVNITDVLDRKIEELSRGYKQRVGLAAALIGDPDLLVLDEPTSGLDPIEQEKIKDFIKLIAKDKTVIFSTHILSEVEDIANRVIIINQGTIVYDGDKPKLKGGVEKLFKKLVLKKDSSEETVL